MFRTCQGVSPKRNSSVESAVLGSKKNVSGSRSFSCAYTTADKDKTEIINDIKIFIQLNIYRNLPKVQYFTSAIYKNELNIKKFTYILSEKTQQIQKLETKPFFSSKFILK